MRHRTVALLAAVPIAAALLTGCSRGASPTEPLVPSLESAAPTAAAQPVAEPAGSSADPAAFTLAARHGRGGGSGDDNGGGRRGRGRGGRGGRGDDDRPNDPRAQPTPRPTPPRAGVEFEARVTAVAGNTLSLSNGTRVVIDGATVWSQRGDLFSLAAVAASVRSGDPTRVEGRGTRQADGAIRAASIKAETDR
jgi:hypothetical protein